MFLIVQIDENCTSPIIEDLEIFFIELPSSTFLKVYKDDVKIDTSIKTGLISKTIFSDSELKQLDKDNGFLLLSRLDTIYEEAVDVELRPIQVGSLDLHFFSFEFNDGIISTSFVTYEFHIPDILKVLTGKDFCSKCGTIKKDLTLFTSIVKVCPRCG